MRESATALLVEGYSVWNWTGCSNVKEWIISKSWRMANDSIPRIYDLINLRVTRTPSASAGECFHVSGRGVLIGPSKGPSRNWRIGRCFGRWERSYQRRKSRYDFKSSNINVATKDSRKGVQGGVRAIRGGVGATRAGKYFVIVSAAECRAKTLSRKHGWVAQQKEGIKSDRIHSASVKSDASHASGSGKGRCARSANIRLQETDSSLSARCRGQRGYSGRVPSVHGKVSAVDGNLKI